MMIAGNMLVLLTAHAGYSKLIGSNAASTESWKMMLADKVDLAPADQGTASSDKLNDKVLYSDALALCIGQSCGYTRIAMCLQNYMQEATF